MRVNSLPYYGMLEQAYKFAYLSGAKLTFSIGDLNRTFEEFKLLPDDTKEYTKEHKKVKKVFNKMVGEIEDYLNLHFLMYEADMTHPKDKGSREVAVMVFDKPYSEFDYDNDYMYWHPDVKDLKAIFYR